MAVVRRPALKEAFGVPERWMALACLAATVRPFNGCAGIFAMDASARIAALPHTPGQIELLRANARHALHGVHGDTSEVFKLTLRLIAWELVAEIREREAALL